MIREMLFRKLEEGNHPVIVALDGRSASGKTTLADTLHRELGAGIIHMDDFFLPPKLRTADRLSQPGGNVHYERFREEVLPGLFSGEKFSYRRFDCHVMELGEERIVETADFYVVEGAYSCHPLIGDYMTFRVFCDISPEEQRLRLECREGKEGARRFAERWIPLEEAYFRAYRIREQADLILMN